MNILFTCAGRRTYLLQYFKENMLVGDKVVATDMQLTAPALQVADVRLQVPSVYDPGYVDITLDICKEHKIDALISLNDLELPILAENKSRFEAIGVKVILSDPQVIELCFDKYKTALWVESIGLNAPKTYIRMEDAKKAIKNGDISFPLIIKPRWGSGSIGVFTIEDMEQLNAFYPVLFKTIKKTILSKVSVGDSLMIQERLTGNEFGLDVINDLEGNYVAVSVKQKMGMRAGETDKALTVDIPEVREIGAMIGRNLHHIGNLDVDIMQRANGEYCVLELNPRFGGGFPFSYEAGVNLPLAIIKWLRGESVSAGILQPKYGRMFAKNDYLMEINNKRKIPHGAIKKNILISSAGQRVRLLQIFQDTIKQLGLDVKVYASDMNPLLSPACHVADDCFAVLGCNEEKYIDELLNLCTEKEIGLIIPTIDPELMVFASNRERFMDAGVVFVEPDLDFIKICRDKRLTSTYFQQKCISVPKLIDRNHPEFPMFAKPYDGSRSVNTHVIMSQDDLTKDIANDPKLIYMEYISRQEYREFTVDMYYGRDFRVKCIVPRERLKVREGEVNKGITRKNYIVDFLKERMGYIEGVRGCICIQLFYRESDNDIKGIEINPRFGGGFPLTYYAKANFVEYLIREYLLGESIDYSDDWLDRTMMLRYDDDIIVNEA